MVALPYLSDVTVMVYVVVKSPLVGGSSNFHTQPPRVSENEKDLKIGLNTSILEVS